MINPHYLKLNLASLGRSSIFGLEIILTVNQMLILASD